MILSIAVGFLASTVVLAVDEAVGPLMEIPAENARALLGATFGAVVTAGAFAFWMRPLAAQLAASAVPSRTVVRRLDDRFQRRTVAVTVGVLAYQAVVVLALPASSDSFAPTVATLVGGALGVMSIAGLFIAMHRAQRATRPSVLVAEAARAVIDQIEVAAQSASGAAVERSPSDSASAIVAAASTGWVRGIDVDALLQRSGGRTVRVEVDVGSFVVSGWTTVASVWDPFDDEPGRDDCQELARCFEIGDERAETLDLAGSLSQFVDIGVHAATGGSAAPSTVYETLWHLGAILHELCRHEVGVSDRTGDGGGVIIHRRTDAAQLVDLAVDRFRQVAAGQPAMALALVRVLGDVRNDAVERGRDQIVEVLDAQCRLVVDQCRHAGALPHDVARVAAAVEGSPDGDEPSDRSEEYAAGDDHGEWAASR